MPAIEVNEERPVAHPLGLGLRAIANARRFPQAATVLALAAIIVFPLSNLLPLDAHFGGDFDISYWMTGYVGQYLRLYHHPASVFNSTESLGIAFPVLYGVLFYRLTGLLSALTDTNLALRMVIFGSLAAEVLSIYRTARLMRAGRGFALFVCLSVACSTYQLTNLYNRGDLPEWFAVTLLTIAVTTLFSSIVVKTPIERWFCRAIIAASLTLMCATHGITMILGGVVFFGAGLVLLAPRGRNGAITLAVAFAAYAAGAAILLVGYASVAHEIHLTPGTYQFGFWTYDNRIDAPSSRFALFPLDPLTVELGRIGVSTPYLEAPIDYPLLLVAGGVLLRRRDPLALCFLGSAVAVAVVSAWPAFWTLVPTPFHFFQFIYRLTSYVNILTLCALLTVLWRLPVETYQVGRGSLPWIAATIAVFACVMKLTHGEVPRHDVAGVEGPATFFSVGPFDTHANYVTLPQDGPGVPKHDPPPNVGMAEFGQPLPQHYVADRNGLIYTRVLAFPWNEILLDGRIVPDREKRTWFDFVYYGLRVRPKSAHWVQTTFALPSALDRTIRLAEYTFLFELAAVALVGGAIALRRRRVLEAGSL